MHAWVLALQIALLLVPTVAGVRGDSWCGPLMCVNAYVNDTTITYEMISNLGEQQFGWMAIGFGTRMTATPMIIMWPNRDGTLTVSHRTADGHSEPKVVANPPRTASPFPQLSSQTSDATIIAFTIAPNLERKQNIIWAVGTTRPASNSADSRLVQHIGSGSTLLDLSAEFDPAGSPSVSSGPPGSTATSTGIPRATGRPTAPPPFALPELLPYQRLLIAHAVLCSVGFLLILPLGAISARWLRTFTPKWFKLHWILQAGIASPIILVGFALAVVAVVEKEGEHFDDPHKRAGIVLIGLYLVQVIFGTYIHYFKPTPQAPTISGSPESLVYTRQSLSLRPIQNYLHPVLGLAIIGLAFYTAREGFWVEWPQSTGRGEQTSIFSTVWIVCISVLVGLYLGGLALLPRQITQEWRGVQSRSRGRKADIMILKPTESTKTQGASLPNGNRAYRNPKSPRSPKSPTRPRRPSSTESFEHLTDESSHALYRPGVAL